MPERAAEFVRPLMLRPPPALGFRRPGDLPGLVRWRGAPPACPAGACRSSYG